MTISEKKEDYHLHPSIQTASSQIFPPEQSLSMLQPQVCDSPLPIPAPAPQTGRSAGQLALDEQPKQMEWLIIIIYLTHPALWTGTPEAVIIAGDVTEGVMSSTVCGGAAATQVGATTPAHGVEGGAVVIAYTS